MYRSTHSPLYRIMAWLLSVAITFYPLQSRAEDIDIFVGGGGNADNPKILIVLDNTANWTRQSQQWPGGITQGESEVRAIKNVVSTLNSNVDIGLMEFVTGGNANDNGGFIRQAIQPLTVAVKSAFSTTLDTIFNNINSPSEKRNANTPYGNLMYDVYNYFSGGNAYSPNAMPSGSVTPDPNGYTTNYSRFKSPLSDSNACGRNFIIVISNPNSSGPAGDNAANSTTLTSLGGSVSPQINYLNYTTRTTTFPTNLGFTSACYANQAACVTTDYTAACAAGAGYDTCTCGAPTSTGTVTAPVPGGLYTYTAYGQGVKTVAATNAGVTNNSYATAAAAAAAVTAGTDIGGMTCPGGATCTYAAGVASGAAIPGTPVTSSSGTTIGCFTSSPGAAALASDGALTCPSGNACTYAAGAQGAACPVTPTTTPAVTASCYAASPTTIQMTAELACPSGSTCTYSAGATSGASCTVPVNSSGVTTSCFGASPTSAQLIADHGALTCPGGSTCTYTAGATSGATCSVSAGSSSTTASCYATPAAAQTGVNGGDRGGLTCPSGNTCTYAIGAVGASCTPPVTATVATAGCFPGNTAPTNVQLAADATTACPSGNTCTYAGTTKQTGPGAGTGCSNPQVHYNTNRTATPTTLTNKYAVTQTATPTPQTFKYNVTQSALAAATFKYNFSRTSTPPASAFKYAYTQTATPASTFKYVISQTATNTTAAVASPGDPLGTTASQYASPLGITEYATQCSRYAGGCLFGNPQSNYTAPACASGTAHFSVFGNQIDTTLVPSGGSVTPTDGANADEWTRFLHQASVKNSANGADTIKQSVTTYTIDVYNQQPNAATTALLQSMAAVGGGKYFQASSEAAIADALTAILSEIQSVNSTFASASLPVNATNRTQNANQVFIGMFRPEPSTKPRWFGNLKQYAVGRVNGVLDLVDKDGNAATNSLTGFVADCAASFWTTDTTNYWSTLTSAIDPDPASKCATVALSNRYSDLPDGPTVEKGAVAEVLRRGNNPASPSNVVNRNVLTGAASTLVPFNTTNTGLGANLVNFTLGKDVNNDTGSGGPTSNVPRPSIHGDVVHSRPLPINYGGSTGVTVYYGSNDGTLRAVDASPTGGGKERWAYIAPEFYNDSGARLQRLMDNTPTVAYPPTPAIGSAKKDYFFDGSIGVFQNANNSKVYIYPAQRRGGRMVYGFDVTTPTSNPTLLWRKGCPNQNDDIGCSTGFDGIGQTWSTPSAAFVNGYSTATTLPVVAMGGGYDKCEDAESSSPSCSSPKGSVIYFIDATNGSIVRSFNTDRSVVGDVSLIDVNNDGLVDYAYAADTGGNIYRVDFVNSPTTLTALTSANWTMRKVAKTNGGGRKFLFGPGLFSSGTTAYLALVSGDREHPLITSYPYTTPVVNRAYVYKDDLTATSGGAVDLDNTSQMLDFTGTTTCNTPSLLSSPNLTKKGWFMSLNANGTGEQGVTSAVIVAGMVTFSTNMPVASNNSCGSVLGNAYGYFVNLFNASGTIGTANNASCGGNRSSLFAGGGLPPSPVVGVVPIDGVPTAVLIGAPPRDGSNSSPIKPTKIDPPISRNRTRTYNYVKEDNK